MSYGREPVLTGADLAVGRSSIWGLVGDNGSGKSTLLKILAGILRPERGRFLAPQGNVRIGYMPENCQWYPHLTGAQVLRYFARYTGADDKAQEAVLDRVGLWAARDKKVRAYSKGMKQKLGLAQAIVGQPDLLILDEPTNGLDPRGIADFYQILKERVAAGAAVVLSSHLLAELDGRISHLALLRQGRIAVSGPSQELVQQADLPYRVVWRHQPGSNPQTAIDNAAQHGWSLSQNGEALEAALPAVDLQNFLHLLGTLDDALADIQIYPPKLEDFYLRTVAAPARANGRGHLTAALQEGEPS